MVAGMTAAPVLAAGNASTPLSTSLKGGPLSVAVDPSSASYAFTLNGTDQAQSQPLSLEPSDLTGTGDGWNVTVSSSPLQTAGGRVVPDSWAMNLNSSASDIMATDGLTASSNGTGTYTLPVPQSVSYPVPVPGLSGGSVVPGTVYGAEPGSGLGSFAMPVDMWLSVPANALAGDYSSIVTWTITSGPAGAPGAPPVTTTTTTTVPPPVTTSTTSVPPVTTSTTAPSSSTTTTSTPPPSTSSTTTSTPPPVSTTTTTTTLPLAAPSGLLVAPSDSQVALSWAPVSGADSYVVSLDGHAYASTTATTYNVGGLSNDTDYTFTVSAANGGQTSASSNPVQATPEAAPGAPGALTATPIGDGEVALSWAPAAFQGPQGPVSYSVYVDDPTLAQTGISGTSYNVTGLTPGTSYSFTVTATDSYGQEGDPSSVATVTAIAAPAAPSGLSATQSGNEMDLTWTAIAAPAGSPVTGYYVYRSDQGSTPIATVSGAASSSYTDTGFTPGSSYTYSVAAYNVVGTSAPASTALLGTLATPAAPSLAPGDEELQVSSAPVLGASGYEVFIDSALAQVVSGTSYTADGLTDGTSYSVQVVATSASAVSALSPAASAVPWAVPAAPADLAVTAVGDGSVGLSWAAAQVPTGQQPVSYTVYECSGTGCGLYASGTTAATSFTASGLSNGDQYSFTVSVTDALGDTSAQAAPVTATPVAAPAAPSGLSATQSDSSVALTWAEDSSAAAPASGYYVYRDGSQVATVTGTSWTDASITPGETYAYAVAAFNDAYTSAQSGLVQLATLSATTVSATPTDGQVALSWTTVPNAAGYEVFGDGTLQASVGSTSWTATGLTNGTTYGYYVVATDNDGSFGPASPTVHATPEVAPGAPTGLSATVADSSTVVSWVVPGGTQAAQLPLAYTLYQDGSAVQSGLSGTSASVTGLSDGTSYSFTVSATDAYLQSSSPSSAAVVTPIAAPGAAHGSGDERDQRQRHRDMGFPGYHSQPGDWVLRLPWPHPGRDHQRHQLH